MTFAFAVARTDQPDSFPEFKVITAGAMGPAFVREKKAKAIMSLIVSLVPASWRAEGNSFKLSHHRFAPKRKWNSVNASMELCSVAINILIVSNSVRDEAAAALQVKRRGT